MIEDDPLFKLWIVLTFSPRRPAPVGPPPDWSLERLFPQWARLTVLIVCGVVAFSSGEMWLTGPASPLGPRTSLAAAVSGTDSPLPLPWAPY
jgi:hypothetical protein